MNNITKISVKYALILCVVALVTSALNSWVYEQTKLPIETIAQQRQQNLFNEVLNPSLYDKLSVAEETPLGELYQAKKQGKTTAYILIAQTTKGYGGKIKAIMSFTPPENNSVKILAVRILEHSETPGLGDKIELRLSNWILFFNDFIYSLESAKNLAVKKDGGQFDAFSGATITPRAVVNLVRDGAEFILHRAEISEKM